MIFGLFGKKNPGNAHAPTEFEDTRTDRKPGSAAKPAVGDAELLRRQRSCLFEVIRECMIASGVLSSGYKFKVLSADSTHQQFMVMFDLGPEFNTDTHRLRVMEDMIRQTAARRHQLLVKGCYWRVEGNEQPQASAPAQQPAQDAAPDALDTRARAKAQLAELFATSPHVSGGKASGFGHTEFAATEFGVDASEQQGQPASYVLLTGYEDTEVAASQFKPTQLDDHK